MNLHQLAEKYHSDKLTSHSYIPLYESLLAEVNVKRVFEVGIGFRELMTPFVKEYVHGSSLKMWRDYLPDAEIFACDVRPEVLINEGRIHSMVADQSKADDLAKVLSWANGSFDFICDDGSHQTQDQIFTAQFFLPTLSPNGLYCIEDVREPFVVAAALEKYRPSVFQFKKRPDDTMIVIAI